jgi:hypothetical protein
MERREVLKSMALAFGGTLTLPAWASGWNTASLEKTALLSVDQNLLLAEVVETFIPTTDTPGAKEIGVQNFVSKMIADCYEKSAQETLTRGLDAIDSVAKQTFGKSFADCNKKQKQNLLEGAGLSDDQIKKDFYSLVKGLTIQGYMSSEYVMSNIKHYELIPGRFHGCVKI